MPAGPVRNPAETIIYWMPGQARHDERAGPVTAFMLILLAILFGCIVGISLGLTGGGGSIFAIPLLVYGLGLTMTDAVPVSLAAVGLTAAVGAWYSYRAGLLLWQPVVMFAAGGIVGAPMGITLGRDLEPALLIAGFSMLTLIIGALMLRKSFTSPADAAAVRALSSPDDKDPICKLAADGKLTFTTPCAAILAVSGLVTGLLSGLFGVGGGFLIVPALMLVIELGIHRAVAASLVVITVIGLSGAASAFWNGELYPGILLPFVCGGIIGMMAGRLIAARLAGPLLQRIFAAGILLVGIGMLLHTLL